MQLSLFNDEELNAEIPLHEFFEAYFECRRNKRTTMNALAFEADYEHKLVELYEEVKTGNYHVGRFIAFIVEQPVKREIFAADFRDRVIHHLLVNKLNPVLEKLFINDSYACRKNKGTLFGIRRIDRFIRQCSENYRKDCYILKLDIEGFFMHINRQLLYERLLTLINERYQKTDKSRVISLVREVVLNNPVSNCTIKGCRSSWNGLPDNKSLFNASCGCGLPIGNLTSQIFANFYMNSFDHFMKHSLNVRYYGRYVDDFVIVHPDKDYLKNLIPVVRNFLWNELGLKLHARKIYLQHYSKGVKYLGAVIKPYRIHTANRTIENFYNAVHKQNSVLSSQHPVPTYDEQSAFLSCLNSYLGFMKHYNSYKSRTCIIKKLSELWWHHVAVTNHASKFLSST